MQLFDSALNQDTVAGTAQVHTNRLPCLEATSMQLGSAVTFTLHGEVGGAYGSLLSLPTSAAATPFGACWLDPGVALVMDLGVMGTLESRSVSFTIPADAALRALPIAIQSIYSRSTTSLSNPVIRIIY